MKLKYFISLMFLSFVIEIIIAYMFINRIESVKSNPVLINECLKSVEENWGRSDSYVNKYDYSIVDNYGKLIYKNADDIAISINDGIKKNDIMLDVSVDGKTVGKIIFDNKTIKKIDYYRKMLMLAILCISMMQLFLIVIHYTLTRKNIIRPFEKLDTFARRVAQGNLDIPLEIDKGHIFGSFTEAFDLMRLELKKSRMAEKKAYDEKKEAIAQLSHDIKTPVASIKSTSELGYEFSDNEKAKDCFNQINVKSDQLISLVDNLFNSSVNDVAEIEVKPLNQPSYIIKDIIKNADSQNKANDFEVPECKIYVDKLRLLQVFDNIFMNSYKYAGTDIKVDVYIEDDSLVVKVSDKGPGVMEDELPLLKGKYRRGIGAEGKDGAGLGLYLCNYYMENMDGRIVLDNLNQGFCVSLYLRII